MQPDRFTISSRQALEAAISLAAARNNAQVQPEHLLAALLGQDGSIVPGVLRKLGVAMPKLREDVDAALDALPTLQTPAEPATAPEVSGVLRAADVEMRDLGDEYLSTEHLLLALAGYGGATGDILRGAGASRIRFAARSTSCPAATG